MITAIFTFILALVNAIFWFVEMIVGVAFSPPVWLIALTNITSLLGIAVVIIVIASNAKNSDSAKKG